MPGKRSHKKFLDALLDLTFDLWMELPDLFGRLL
jgi:hypothetical protein